MKRFCLRLLSPLLFVFFAARPAWAMELIPVGQVVGLSLDSGTVTVAAFSESSPAQEAGVKLGDRLVRVDGKAVTDIKDVRSILRASGETVELLVRRDNGEKRFQVTLREGQLGLYLRQGITGIGTVTYYDPATGTFGALGHGIAEAPGAQPIDAGGSVYHARVTAVRPGEAGKPGQLLGAVTDPQPFATLTANTPQGVFGKSDVPFSGQALPVGDDAAVHTGEASILCTINGSAAEEYSVQICRVYPAGRKNGRNLLIKVTDPDLLATTNGIVQGMSGSPIIQDGKLIGAVTHVLVNDPTTGYGIFIENMLDAVA